MRKFNVTPVLFVLLLAAVLTAPAFAGGPLAVCNSGQPYLWPAGGSAIPFNPDQGDLGPVNAVDAVQLVADAFQVWEDVPTSTVAYVNAGVLPVDVDINNFGPYLNPVAPDGLSAIVFDDDGQIFDLLFGPGSGILGFAGPEWVNTVTCDITEGVSFLNGPSFTNLTAALDVMVHEFGHYTNLAHTVVNGQNLGFADASGPSPFNDFGNAVVTQVESMYPFYFGAGSGTQTLHKDDMASVSELYPEANFFSSTGSIEGAVLASNGTTRLSGVNIIARNVADPFNDAVSSISGDYTDGTTQSDPVVGTYTIHGLTPGADYVVFIDQILAGGFSTPPLATFPGPEEYYNGANESGDSSTDDPHDSVNIGTTAGVPNTGIDIIFNGLGPGQIDLGDDDTVQLALPFAFEICGTSYNAVFVNSNGSLSFGAGSTDFSESVAEFLSGPPRIALLWDDLNPSAAGTVSFSQTSNDFTVTFDSVPEFFSTGANTFTVTLNRSSNHINVVYGDISAADAIVGVSCGGAITSSFETGTDLSAFAPSRINLHNAPAVFEQFTASAPNDLGNSTVRYNGTTDYNDNWAEPNNTLGSARNINLPFNSIDLSNYTEIEPTGGDIDFFRFQATGGQTLLAEVVAGQLDSLIGLFDANGNLLAVDDDGGSGLLSLIQFPIPATGTYVLAVTTFGDGGFTGAGGSGGRYVLDVQSLNGFLLPLGDDTSFEVNLPFSFPYQGGNYSSVFVNSNGNLTFGGGDTDFSESVSEFLNELPRVAMLWDDLSPNQAGSVIYEADANSATITFDGVPEFFAATTNTFSVTLGSDGSVSLDYGAVAAQDGIVGVTEGGFASNPGETDLSAGGGFSVTGTTYEQFTSGDAFDLSGASVDFN